MSYKKWYDDNYRKLLFIPAIILLISVAYLTYFYVQTGEIIHKDVTLTGGTSYTIATDYPAKDLENVLSKEFRDFSVRGVAGSTGDQIEVIVTVNEEQSERMRGALEDELGFELNDENSSIEFTDASLSADFFNQLIIAVVLAFFWMAAIVFVIFSKGWKVKTWIIIGNLAFAIFLGNFLFSLPFVVSIIIFLAFAGIFIYTYIKNSVPAFAVMLSAFADIVMTLAVVNLFEMKLSTAGIVAFLMLIGYSVDTDILLTTRILNKRESVNKVLLGAFKTGSTMMVTSALAVTAALIVVYPFQSVLNQIFTILLIGLGFDVLNTWITNASIIKWYAETKL